MATFPLSTNSFDVSALRNFNSDAIYKAYRPSKNEEIGELYQQYGEDGATFSDIFDKALENIKQTNNYLSDAENEEIKWTLGEATNPHDLNIAISKAQAALQYTVAVRDRAIAAYREIIQMQI